MSLMAPPQSSRQIQRNGTHIQVKIPPSGPCATSTHWSSIVLSFRTQALMIGSTIADPRSLCTSSILRMCLRPLQIVL